MIFFLFKAEEEQNETPPSQHTPATEDTEETLSQVRSKHLAAEKLSVHF